MNIPLERLKKIKEQTSEKRMRFKNEHTQKKTIIDLCVSSLCRGLANLLCIIPIFHANFLCIVPILSEVSKETTLSCCSFYMKGSNLS